MANAANFNARWNDRKSEELLLKGEFIEIKDLKQRRDLERRQIYEKYLLKEIPDYPTPVEFHITEVAHVSHKHGLPGILNSGGFKGLDKDSFSWWNMKITDADIIAAEERFLQSFLPDLTKEERAAHEPFLRNFTTSPLFHETSRYGNFRFTFPVTDLMEAFKKQICDGEEPILRVFGTKLFKQEIEYVIVVHSPQCNTRFAEFPELPNPLVTYDGKPIIWKAQAICETHNYQLQKLENTAVIEPMFSHQFYVWDQVSLVFHLEGDKILAFSEGSLQNSITSCKIDPNVNLSKGGSFSSLNNAKKFLTECMQKFACKYEKEENESEMIKKEVD